MHIKSMTAKFCYGINALYFLIAGLKFVFAKALFQFHLDVLQTSWDELSQASQTLYLGMMRTEGAGFLAASAALIILLAIPYRRGAKWAAPAMTLIGIAEHTPTLLANLHVAQNTSAAPPWQIAATGIALLVLGLGLSVSGKRPVNPV